MKTTEPRWTLDANLCAGHPFATGGLLVFRDVTGQHAPEGDWIEAPRNPRHARARWRVYRFRLKPLPDPDAKWDALVLAGAAEQAGLADIRADLRSREPARLGRAYAALGNYYGWTLIDDAPVRLDRAAIARRYPEFA
jgi:hypothetical protein